MKARLRPQRKQRRTIRVLNFGFFRARALVEVLATIMLINADGNADSRWQKEKTLTLIRVPVGVICVSEILANQT